MPAADPGPAEPGRSARHGVAWATAAFLWWGLSPLYWKALGGVDAGQLLAHRVAWSLALLVALLAARGRGPELRAALARPRTLATLVATTALIGANWFTYIWAVGAERVLEASLGYYVNPLVNVLLGMLFLRERLRRAQGLAVLLAAAGVAVLTAEVGRLPWVALVLALTFGFYGLLRKTVAAGPEVGLAVETALLAPFALAWLVRLHAAGAGAFGHGPAAIDLLLVASGVITVLPMVWFTRGARLLPLSTLGLLQYLSPTLQFLLAVAVYREPFTAAHLLAFGLIWSGLAVFTWDLRRRLARRGGG
jgi:chloramphenicol-sensitive protein RarD